MKIRKSKYHQKSVKVVHCGALIWRKFPINCDAHLVERFLKGRENKHLLKSLFELSVIFMPSQPAAVLLQSQKPAQMETVTA